MPLNCHVAFGQTPLTRKEGAKNVRKLNYIGKQSQKAQKVLNTLLEKYENEGVKSIEKGSILKISPFDKMRSPFELVRTFGKTKDFEKAIEQLKNELYKTG